MVPICNKAITPYVNRGSLVTGECTVEGETERFRPTPNALKFLLKSSNADTIQLMLSNDLVESLQLRLNELVREIDVEHNLREF